jgi:hypothetical protein
MRRSPHSLTGWIVVAMISIWAATGYAQNASSSSPATGSPQQSADMDWLAKTAKIYYSSAKAGLAGFNCQVHPDWQALIAGTAKNGDAPASDANLAQLKNVKITMHARMRGGSTIEWLAGSSDDPNGVMENMHQTVQQTLEGFLQFWSPFMEVTVVPSKTEGIEITHSPTSHIIHAKQGSTELTEIFNSNLVLEHFDVVLAGTSIKFAPTFDSTPKGLLVKTFTAEILPAGATPQQMQKMQVRLDYQTVNNQTLPKQLNMDIAGSGSFSFAFDGCSTESK